LESEPGAIFLFDAFSSREPASTSLENAMLMVNANPEFVGVLEHFSAKGKPEKARKAGMSFV